MAMSWLSGMGEMSRTLSDRQLLRSGGFSSICRPFAHSALSLALAFCTVGVTVAQAKGKRQRHPGGFSFELPDGWRVENGRQGAMLAPPGSAVDPEREDNPEVYTVWPSQDGTSPADDQFVDEYRRSLLGQGATLENDGRKESFGRYGSIFTFDFVHPDRKTPFRVRIFRMQAKGRPIALIATGLRTRLAARERVLREIAASLDYDR
jgi:hypothetical protein